MILLTFTAFIILQKSINLWWLLSLWCELLHNLAIYTLKSDQWITIWEQIWVGISTNVHLLIQNSKSLAKMETLNASTSQLIPKKKSLSLHSPYCIFCIKIATLRTLESTVLDEIIRYARRWFILAQKIYKFQFGPLNVSLWNKWPIHHIYFGVQR